MDIVVTGGGIGGLTTALLLSGDGHDVTVLERDPAAPPEPEKAWEEWERRGVNQFRLPHFFVPRFRSILEAELPDLVNALEGAGMLRFNFLDQIPDQMKGGKRPGDEDFAVITGRRSVFESVVAAFAEAEDGVTVRRGAAVRSLAAGPETTSGVPHVTGVVTELGETIPADLVVDASGRRSALPRWLTDIGAEQPTEELEDCGFVYYGRHFRSADGTLPAVIGPPLQHYGSISALCLPADNGTWSTTLVVSARDEIMRGLRDVDTWTSTVKALPLAAHWLDGSPLDDRVMSMSKIEDRHRGFAGPTGGPLATGVVAVADSWACTNPSLGRGASIGAIHAQALRDLLRSDQIDAPLEFAAAWNEVTAKTVEPWYRSTLFYDRHRLGEVHAAIAGEPYDPGDPKWTLNKALDAASGRDGDCLRATLSVASVMRTPDELFAEPGFLDKVNEFGGDHAEAPGFGPDREQLLAIVGS